MVCTYTGSGKICMGSGMVNMDPAMVYTGSGMVYTGILRNSIHRKIRVVIVKDSGKTSGMSKRTIIDALFGCLYVSYSNGLYMRI